MKEKNKRDPIAREVAHSQDHSTRATGKRSILELQGLGKNLWQKTDTTDDIDSERGAWD